MRNSLEKMIRGAGADIFGTSELKDILPSRFSGTPYAVTIGIRLSNAVMDEVEHGPTKLYFHHYRTANAFLDSCALSCAMWLQRQGFDALAIPASQTTDTKAIAGDFPHKTAANAAGLGFVGKSGLFITNDYGPRVRFATVLTSLALPSGKMQENACGDCTACVSACPCGAITGNIYTPGCGRDHIVDASLCSRYMKKKYSLIGRGAVCGICAAVCPFGIKPSSNKQ